MTQEVKLGDYATKDGLYFRFDYRVYYTAGSDKSNVAVTRWEDGEPVWMPVETLVVPLAMPPRPARANAGWLACRDTTVTELRRGFQNYMRQMEAYVDALESKAKESA